MQSTKITQKLALLTANAQVLYVKLHNYHWNLKDPDFRDVHEYSESLYNELGEQFDEFAERILVLGGRPPSTMKEYLELATIKERPAKAFSVQEVYKEVLADFTTMLGDLEELHRLASEADDPATDDLAVGYIAAYQKHIWMLNASIEA